MRIRVREVGVWWYVGPYDRELQPPAGNASPGVWQRGREGSWRRAGFGGQRFSKILQADIAMNPYVCSSIA